MDLQAQHHPPLHRLADPAATRVKDTKRQRRKDKERQKENSTTERGGIIVPAAEGSTCPTEEGGPPTWSIWLQGGTLHGREGNRDYAAGTVGTSNGIPQLHGSQWCCKALKGKKAETGWVLSFSVCFDIYFLPQICCLSSRSHRLTNI